MVKTLEGEWRQRVSIFTRIAFAGSLFFSACGPIASPPQREETPPTVSLSAVEKEEEIKKIEELLAEMREIYPECMVTSPTQELADLSAGVSRYQRRVVQPGTADAVSFDRFQDQVSTPFLQQVAQNLQSQSLSEREVTEGLAQGYDVVYGFAKDAVFRTQGDLSSELAHLAGCFTAKFISLRMSNVLKGLKSS